MSATDTGILQSRIVGFGDSISLGFKNYFQFEGRSSRGAYWYFSLFLLIVSVATAFFDALFIPENELSPLSSLFSLATLIPSISISVRRLHDIGRSGWWNLLAFTIIGIIPLIYWVLQPGNRAENGFGPDREAGRA